MFDIHFRLRFFTVVVLTSLSALYRLPVRSPEYERHSSASGFMANVDLGHFVAATDPQGTPLDFLNKFHDRIASFHIKDRTTAAHCALNLAWGTGETPIKEILRLVRDKKWDIPASIELEYEIPQGSDAVIENKKCVEYCKAALTS